MTMPAAGLALVGKSPVFKGLPEAGRYVPKKTAAKNREFRWKYLSNVINSFY